VALNVLNPPVFMNPVEMNMGQTPMDLFSAPRLLNTEKDEEEEFEENEQRKIQEKFMLAIDKQNEMLENFTISLAKEREEDFNDQRRFLDKKLKKYDKFEENPQDFFKREEFNQKIYNNNIKIGRRVLDPIEMMYKFKKFKEKTKKYDPPENFPPFLNPIGAPLGMNQLPLELISPGFSDLLLQDDTFGMSPFNKGPVKNNMFKKKAKTKENDEKYKKIMKAIVKFYIIKFIDKMLGHYRKSRR